MRMTRLGGLFAKGALFVSVTCLSAGAPTAQARLHLNGAIEKLARGELVFGVSTPDLSMSSARALTRADLDWIYVDMEHGPMDFATLHQFLIGMIDKAAILRQGTAQPKVTPFARLAPYGAEQAQWAIKQALDMGLMGVMVNSPESREQVLTALKAMRYPPRAGAPPLGPVGIRGLGPGNALWFWGISQQDYIQRADLWPLNPRGDLLAMMLVETAEGLKNIDDIASTPGVGAIYIGPGDLASSLGVPPNSPETEAAVQLILKACQVHKVVCGITASAADMPRRIKEGFRILGAGRASGELSASTADALRAGRAVVK